MNRLAVDGDDHVAFLHARLIGRPARFHSLDENAFSYSRHFQVGASLIGLGASKLYADRTAGDLAVLDYVVVDLRRGIDR